MYSKLTLSIDKNLTKKAKVYAKKQGRSLSDLVKSYFQVLTSDESNSELEVSAKLQALRGVLKVSDNYDYKKELSDALAKKYLK